MKHGRRGVGCNEADSESRGAVLWRFCAGFVVVRRLSAAWNSLRDHCAVRDGVLVAFRRGCVPDAGGIWESAWLVFCLERKRSPR